MKKYVIGFLAGIIASISITTFAAVELNIIPNPFPVIINGVQQEVTGYTIDGRTYLKLRDFEKAGLKVDFDDTKKQIIVTSPKVTASTAAPETTINNTEVNVMSTETATTVDTTQWISLRDFSASYPETYENYIRVIQGQFKTDTNNSTYEINTSKGKVRVTLCNGWNYLNISDLRSTALMD